MVTMAKMSRSAVSKKAWITRKANAKKKRGVKPGTKRGSYNKARKAVLKRLMQHTPVWNVVDPGPAVGELPFADGGLSMVETLDAAITRLEVAVGNSTDRINSLVGKF